MAVAESPTLPKTMRAYAHATSGKPQDVLSLTELPLRPLPAPGSNDVLVRVSHATICFGGTFMIFLTPSIFTDKPLIPHYEFSGTIVAVDPESHQPPHDPPLSVGTPVFGAVPMSRSLKRVPGAAAPSGALAEYVLIPATRVVRKPENVPFDQAAGIAGVSSCTALTMVKHAKIQQGYKVLVYGASGSVGTFAVQLAREAAGPSGMVIAVCGPSGRASVTSLGADEVCDFAF
jgi:NADPH:quinone reductase-like Zn-dependent oxidoreductase